jgi:hypothetical protein
MLLFYSLEKLRLKVYQNERYNEFPNIGILFKSCLNKQPLGERIHSCVTDLKDWIVQYEHQLDHTKANHQEIGQIFKFAWEVYIILPKDLFITKFQSPTQESLDYYRNLILDPRTLSDTLAHLIKTAREYVYRFLNLQRTLEKIGENEITNPHLKAMKMKIEQLINIIAGIVLLIDNIMEAKISFSMLRTISELVVQTLSLYDPDPFSGLLESGRNLESKLSIIVETSNEKYLAPPKVQIEVTLSPLIKVQSNLKDVAAKKEV